MSIGDYMKLLLTLLLGCASFSGNYADPNKLEIVDDKWNESDARLTAEKMIKSALEKQWIVGWTQEHSGKRPFIIVDDFENRTSEHIDTQALFEATSNELLNSGRIRFLDASKRKKILEEVKFQNSGAVHSSSSKKQGKQIGADFLLTGSLSSIVSQQDGYKTVTYQVQMKLTDIESSEIVWSEVYKLKKQFKRSAFGT